MVIDCKKNNNKGIMSFIKDVVAHVGKTRSTKIIYMCLKCCYTNLRTDILKAYLIYYRTYKIYTCWIYHKEKKSFTDFLSFCKKYVFMIKTSFLAKRMRLRKYYFLFE